MHFKIIRKHEQTAAKWAGGTTTQLAIFPETATYKLRDFVFRISTAMVETEESEFTDLPGISRCIMVLDGILKLNHQGHYTKTLHKFDTDFFDGGWKTISLGKVTDFNLMTAPSAKGKLWGTSILMNERLTDPQFNDFDFVGLYLLCGKFEAAFPVKKIVVNRGDFLLINNQKSTNDFAVKALEYCEIAVAAIRLDCTNQLQNA